MRNGKQNTIDFPLQGTRIELQTVPCINGKRFLARAFQGEQYLASDVVSMDKVNMWRAQSAHEYNQRARLADSFAKGIA